MPDMPSLVNEFTIKLKKRQIEGSKATSKLTAELLRSFISQQRLPNNNQAAALIDAVKAVGEKLIASNPVELAIGNVVRRVLHIIREEDLTLTTASIGGLSLSDDYDYDNVNGDDHPVLSASAVAAAARNALRPPSLQTLLEDLPHHPTAAHHTSSTEADSEEKTADKSSSAKKLKHNVIEAVNELIQEISTCHEQIAEQAVEHIHQNILLKRLLGFPVTFQ